MENTKKSLSLKKRWIKRLTQYKITNTKSSDDSDSRKADTNVEDRNRCQGGIFGSFRRVRNRVKLCVSNRKVRTLETRGKSDAFSSTRSLDGPRNNIPSTPSASTEVPSFENVDATQVPFCAMKDRTSSAGETEESTSPISDRSNQVDFTLPAASLVFHTAEATQCINACSLSSLEGTNYGNALIKEITNLANCCWYWGPLTRREAEEKLSNQRDGSFLIRDSSTDKYLFCISFRSIGQTLHSHIDHITGYYSLFNTARYTSIAELVDHAVKVSQDSLYCYTKPRDNARPRFPVRLMYPLSRFTQVRSLQHLCRFVIRQTTSINNISRLPIPMSLQTYLRQGHY